MLTAEPMEHLLVPEIRVAPSVPQVNTRRMMDSCFAMTASRAVTKQTMAVLSVGIPFMQRIFQRALKNMISLNGIAIVGQFLATTVHRGNSAVMRLATAQIVP